MTPEEKAKQLININFKSTFIKLGKNMTTNEILNLSKECALIAVDEIINFNCYTMPIVKESMLDYLNEVKQEINKL